MAATTDWLSEAKTIEKEIISLRRVFHMDPELGRHEFKTQDRILKILSSVGIEAAPIADTGVLGVIHGEKPGNTVALRADMDALPMTEMTGCSYSSRNKGVMHACGHDMHMAALLGAAKLLAAHREEIRGDVKLFFQPNEEDDGGAKRMIEEGCMENVSAVFGMHVTPDLPKGMIGIRYGKFYAAANSMHLTVHGKAAHGAAPEKGIDALDAAIAALAEIKKLPALYSERGSGCVLTIGTFSAGTAENIVPDRADMQGVLRILGTDDREKIMAHIRLVTDKVMKEKGTSCELTFASGYPGIVNTEPETEIAERTACGLFGKENVVRIESPYMTTEDFGFFQQASSGSYFHLGAGCDVPLHNNRYLPDEAILSSAAAMFAELAANYLAK